MKRATSYRLDADLLDRVKVEADRRGQKVTTFIERALEKELGTVAGERSAQPGGASVAPRTVPAPSRAPKRVSPRQAALNQPKGL